jgi:heme-degrading monooxygenase HmoA
MQHVRVALYRVKPGNMDEIIRRAEAGMLPTFRSQPGFVAYGLVITGEDSAISITIWQSEEQANAAVKVAASWVRDNIAEMVESVQNHIGNLALFSSTGALGS